MPKIGPAGSGIPAEGVNSYSARVQAADPAGPAFGGSQRTLREIGAYQNPEVIKKARDLTDDGTDYGTFMDPLNAPTSNYSPTGNGILNRQQAIFGTKINDNTPAAIQRRKYETLTAMGYDSWASQHYNPVGIDDDRYDNADNFNENFDRRNGMAVALSDIPTSSTNYRRPRTVAAGYDPDSGTLTVVFRDGTFWNYYSVPPSTWIEFHDSYSKGPMVNKANKNQAFDGALLSYQNGPADISQLSATAQEFFYNVLRTGQIYYSDRSKAEKRAIKREGKTYAKTGGYASYGRSAAQTGGVPKSVQNVRSRQRRNATRAYNNQAALKMQSRAGKNPNQK